MTDFRTDVPLDALLHRLAIPAEPDGAFVTESLAGLLPAARRARAQDRRFLGRVWRDLRAIGDRGGTRTMPRSLLFVTASLVLALVAALIVVYVGSQRRLPPP